MANERVSQLLELYAGELATSDLFLITDMSARESKKLTLASLMDFIERSGSFDATSAATAETASYVAGINVHGTVTSASHSELADDADSASYALYAQNAHQSVSASYASAAASLIGGIGAVVSASHALKADFADNATNASYVYYSGVPNGTVTNGLTASYANILSIGHSGINPAATRGIDIYGAVNDGVTIAFSGSIDDGNTYFRTWDNGTEGFRWQTHQSSGGGPVIDRMSLSTTTSSLETAKLRVHGDISASAYTASISNAVGFIGTASYAATASYTDNIGGISCRAWAFVTWSAAHSSSCSLYKAKNVSSIRYLGTTNPNAANTLDWYGISFINPMPNLEYMAMGTVIGYVSNYAGIPIQATIVQNPAVGNWITTGCTMSIWVTSSMRTSLYSGATQASIQVLG